MNRCIAIVATATLLTNALATTALASGSGGATAAVPAPRLTADVNRDGLLTRADDAGKHGWTDGRGAIFLPNLDDDEHRCTVAPAELDAPGRAVDDKLAACNDAADDRINGPRDAADLAPLTLDAERNLSANATGTVTIAPADKARIFVNGHARNALTADQLRRCVRLQLEGRDVLRDPAVWDGQITVTVSVADNGRTATDSVRMRVAPLMLQNDLQPAQTVLAAQPAKGQGWWGSTPPYQPGAPGDWPQFAKTLRTATKGRELRFLKGTPDGWKDMWAQDTFEPATVSMPTVGGTHTMRILIRSGNLWDLPEKNTPRPAGRLLYRDLRGPDIGVVQQFGDNQAAGVDDLLNMGGNIELLPPYPGYPHGRVYYGSGARRPDPTFLKLTTGQGYQSPISYDTSWLLVGHADETVHVVRANNARGWTLAVADPRLAVRLLRDVQRQGGGSQQLFADTRSTRKPTVDELLSGWLTDNEAAAKHIDDQLAILLKATGLRTSDLVQLPVFFANMPGYNRLKALTPDLVNGLSVTDRQFAAPDPHGPRLNGRDVFRQATEQALAKNGVRVHWVEDFFWAHLGGGEVHCATNALQDTREATPWWSGNGVSGIVSR
ncbi:protein-arginine deiminase family protein [Kribbella solani]|uniref:protein-arginine deiminase family protein n=1 Tax=Kribbella solani TaxID=236067 RepID=UPI0029B4F8B5|nr:protein-arginine deiminase family protein [Kribbella solani]MDX3004053.1 protein-arginine deiminase family protein [Kribbella solani]